MSYNMNFETPIEIVGGKLRIAGNSPPIDDAARFASRHVTLRQGMIQVDAEAPPGISGEPGWRTAELDGTGFTTAPAVAMGIETYVVDDAASQSPLATTVTVNWSQIVQINA